MRGPAIALLGFAIFSSHDALVKALSDYSVFQIIFFAMLFGYVPFSLVLAIDKRERSLWPRQPAWVMLRAATMTSAMTLAFMGFTLLPMVQVYVLLFMTPIIISLLSIPLLGERIHGYRWMAIALGMLGVLVVLRPGSTSFGFGHFAALSAAFCSALSAIIARKVGNTEHAHTMVIYPLMASIIVTGGALPFVYQPMPLGDLLLMFLIGGLGLLGQLCILNAYRMADAALVAPTQYSQLLWAVLFGVLFFGEGVDVFVVLGALIIIASGLLIVWRETQVSSIKPLLSTRNLRGVMAPPMQPVETDDRPDDSVEEKR